VLDAPEAPAVGQGRLEGAGDADEVLLAPGLGDLHEQVGLGVEPEHGVGPLEGPGGRGRDHLGDVDLPVEAGQGQPGAGQGQPGQGPGEPGAPDGGPGDPVERPAGGQGPPTVSGSNTNGSGGGSSSCSSTRMTMRVPAAGSLKVTSPGRNTPPPAAKNPA